MKSALFAVAVLAIIALTTPATADVITDVWVPISGTLTSPCNGETVTYSGAFHVINRVTVDENGGFHLGIQQNGKGVGQGGTTGATYQMMFAENGVVNTTYAPPFTFTKDQVFRFIAQGKYPDFVSHETYTVYLDLDATGNPVITGTTFNQGSRQAECK